MSRFVQALLVLAALAYPLAAACAEPDVGVVLLHGKWDHPPTHVTPLARTLAAKGFKVATPGMPWAAGRDYDVGYAAALDEIQAAVESLRQLGARRIVLAGHSIGANAALAYAASGRSIDAVIAIVPGHAVDRPRFRKAVAESVEKARSMIAAGQGNEQRDFEDFNQGRTKIVRTSARNYFSFFDPDGMGAMPKSAAAVRQPLPFLLVMATNDPLYASGEGYIFDKFPGHPKSKYLVVQSRHLDAPTDAAAQIVDWIESLGW